MEERTANNPLETPLFQFISEQWPEFEQDIVSVQVQRNDVLLYLLWMLDSIKRKDIVITANAWVNIRSSLRAHFLQSHYTPQCDDLNYITNIIFSFTLYCLGQTISGSFERQDIFSNIIHNLSPDRYRTVQAYRNRITYRDNTGRLKAWLRSYLESDFFYTLQDSIDWNLLIKDYLPALISSPNPNITIEHPHIDTIHVHQGGAIYDMSTNLINKQQI